MTEALISMGLILRFLTSPSFHNELTWVARAMDGETGEVMYDKITTAIWVAHTVYNRVASPDFPNTIEEVVLGGFNGHVHSPDPDPDMYTLAMRVFIERLWCLDHIPAVMYMFSYDDMRTYNFGKSKAVRCFSGIPNFGLCFYEEYPE